MNADALTGSILTVVALAVMIFIVLISRRHIERISGSGCRSAREIEEKMSNNGK